MSSHRSWYDYPPGYGLGAGEAGTDYGSRVVVLDAALMSKDSEYASAANTLDTAVANARRTPTTQKLNIVRSLVARYEARTPATRPRTVTLGTWNRYQASLAAARVMIASGTSSDGGGASETDAGFGLPNGGGTSSKTGFLSISPGQLPSEQPPPATPPAPAGYAIDNLLEVERRMLNLSIMNGRLRNALDVYNASDQYQRDTRREAVRVAYAPLQAEVTFLAPTYRIARGRMSRASTPAAERQVWQQFIDAYDASAFILYAAGPVIGVTAKLPVDIGAREKPSLVQSLVSKVSSFLTGREEVLKDELKDMPSSSGNGGGAPLTGDLAAYCAVASAEDCAIMADYCGRVRADLCTGKINMCTASPSGPLCRAFFAGQRTERGEFTGGTTYTDAGSAKDIQDAIDLGVEGGGGDVNGGEPAYDEAGILTLPSDGTPWLKYLLVGGAVAGAGYLAWRWYQGREETIAIAEEGEE
ncbi:MAG: hypothetical protein ABIK85_04050 [Candidatus Eisenbacteria bacterium]